VAADVSGISLANTAVVGGQRLTLNGAGTSYKFIFSVYVGSLYLPQAVADLPGVLSQHPRRIQMNLLRDVTAEQLVGALLGGIRDNNSPTEVAAVKQSTDELVRILRTVMPAQVRNKDVITMDFVDGGTIVALNGPEKVIGPGQTLRLPNVLPASRDYDGVPGNGASMFNLLNIDGEQPQGEYVVVDKSEGVLKVYDGEPDGDDGKLVAAFPVTMGSAKYPLPIGRWKATTYAYLPPFKYQPAILNNPKTDKELTLPPGPNGPVGVAWLDLTKEHYGIHGTNEPATIGRAESSGCIRMTNWDVIRLSRMLKPGFTAIFQA